MTQSMTPELLADAGFVLDHWPETLPKPDNSNISSDTLNDTVNRYTYRTTVDGQDYAACVDIDSSFNVNPAEGVVFMLNQFAYLYKNKPDRVRVTDESKIYKSNF